MGIRSSLYMLALQLVAIGLFVLLFLLVMLVLVGNVPVSILFSTPGIFLQLVLVFLFWLLLFSVPEKSPRHIKPDEAEIKIQNL